MSSSVRSITIPWTALFFAFLGLLWCGYVAFPTAVSTPCVTAGCHLFQDVRIAGIPLWWVGGGYFFFLCFLCLRGHTHFAWWLSRFALALDCLLLCIMFFFVPCTDCLIVAIFFALTNIFLRPTPQGWFAGERVRLILLPIWLGLFLGNMVLLGNEKISRWSVAKPQGAIVEVYFSPSCTYCKEALRLMGTQAILHPVVQNAGDLERIIYFEQLLNSKESIDSALQKMIAVDSTSISLSWLNKIYYSVQSMRNEAVVLQQRGVLPLIIVNGMPHAWLDYTAQPVLQQESVVPAQQGTQPLPWDIEDAGQCGRTGTEPCDDG